MRLICLLFAALWISACSSAEIADDAASAERSAPELLQTVPNHTFVDSELTLAWEWGDLQPGQVFALRLWVDEEPFQEVWTQASTHDAQTMIDSFSRDVGAYQWQVAVVNTSTEGGFESMGSEWSDVQSLQRLRRLSPTPYPAAQRSELAQMIAAQEFESTTDMLHYLRTWIHEHTDIGEELEIYEADYSDAAQMLVDHANGEGRAPEMYCNGMSTVMLMTLEQLGIESRMVFLYGEVPGWFSQHTVLEVFNPQTQAWEVHDTAQDAYFIDTETGELANMERLVFGPIGTIAACQKGEPCSTRAYRRGPAGLMQAFRYGSSTQIWVNPDRFDIARRVTAFDNANFPEFLSQLTSIPAREFTFHFDNWSPPTRDDA